MPAGIGAGVGTFAFGGSGLTPLRIDLTYSARNEITGESRYSDLAGTTKIGATTYTYDAAGNVTLLPGKSIVVQNGQ